MAKPENLTFLNSTLRNNSYNSWRAPDIPAQYPSSGPKLESTEAAILSNYGKLLHRPQPLEEVDSSGESNSEHIPIPESREDPALPALVECLDHAGPHSAFAPADQEYPSSPTAVEGTKEAGSELRSFLAKQRTEAEALYRGVLSKGTLKCVFDKYDVDKNGSIDIQELAVMLSGLGIFNPRCCSSAALCEILDTMDCNHKNSMIDFEEFYRWYSSPELDGGVPAGDEQTVEAASGEVIDTEHPETEEAELVDSEHPETEEAELIDTEQPETEEAELIDTEQPETEEAQREFELAMQQFIEDQELEEQRTLHGIPVEGLRDSLKGGECEQSEAQGASALQPLRETDLKSPEETYAILAEAHAYNALSQMDTNQDGRIDRNEFCVGMLQSRSLFAEAQAYGQTYFERHDTNNDHILDWNELCTRGADAVAQVVAGSQQCGWLKYYNPYKPRCTTNATLGARDPYPWLAPASLLAY